MNNYTDNIYGEPISIYTDANALEDGVLVAVPGERGVNRVTRAVFDHFAAPIGSAATGVSDITPLMAAIRAMLAVPPNNGWRCAGYHDKELWLVPNEVGGLT